MVYCVNADGEKTMYKKLYRLQKKKTEKLFDKGIRDTHEILKTDTVLC